MWLQIQSRRSKMPKGVGYGKSTMKRVLTNPRSKKKVVVVKKPKKK